MAGLTRARSFGAEHNAAHGAHRALLVSDVAGDRASAYVMSNKIARRGGNLICTWLDMQRQNRWAEIDPRGGQILRSGALDEPRKDNHCGAALATDVDGTLHALVGAHHGAFVHYRLPADKADWEPVADGRAVGVVGTYPSLVCDRNGSLHVLYRRETNGSDAHLVYCRRPRGGPWSEPRLLVRSAVHEHSWLTNALEVDAAGRLHAVVSNTLLVPSPGAHEGYSANERPATNGSREVVGKAANNQILGRDVVNTARYFGASHLYSDDAGKTWRQFGNPAALPNPVEAAQLERIEAAGLEPARMEAHYGGPRGPLHSYYHKMVLSNPVIDDRGRPWAIVHNLLAGEAQLYRHEEQGGWVGVSLTEAARGLLPGVCVRHCGQLARHRDGTIEAVLMVAPEANPGWGDNGTALVRLAVDQAGQITQRELVGVRRPGMPSWLPSLERWCPHAPVDHPALLYTCGANAGGYDHNMNSVRTEVWLDWR